MTEDISEIETGADLDDVVSVVHSICASDDGFLATLELTGETPESCVSRLIQLDSSGGWAGNVSETGLAKGAEDFGVAPVSKLPVSGDGVLVWHDGAALKVEALGEEKPLLLKAFKQIKAGAVTTLELSDAMMVALVEGFDDDGAKTQQIFATKTTLKAPVLKPVEIDLLKLSDIRQITATALIDTRLFLAVSDPIAGFDIFMKDLANNANKFKPVLTRGAYRFALNAAVSSMIPDGRSLLIGTAALATGAPPNGIWAPELIQLDINKNDWVLMFGQQRLTPVGLKQPSSGLGAGIDSFNNAAVKAIATGEQNGKQVTYVVLQDYLGDPEADRALVTPQMFDYFGDMRLFRSESPDSWVAVEHQIDPEAGAVTSLCVAPDGVLVAHEGIGGSQIPVSFVALS